MDFEFVYIYRHIYRKWGFLVDSKCRNTIILTGLTCTSSWKVFHDACTKRGTFSHQILNKNSLSLVHCALNRSFTVIKSMFNGSRSIKLAEVIVLRKVLKHVVIIQKNTNC